MYLAFDYSCFIFRHHKMHPKCFFFGFEIIVWPEAQKKLNSGAKSFERYKNTKNLRIFKNLESFTSILTRKKQAINLNINRIHRIYRRYMLSANAKSFYHSYGMNHTYSHSHSQQLPYSEFSSQHNSTMLDNVSSAILHQRHQHYYASSDNGSQSSFSRKL